MEGVYTSLSLYIIMYTHIKTKHMTLELRSYISLCLLEEELSENPTSLLHLKINSSLKISSDIHNLLKLRVCDRPTGQIPVSPVHLLAAILD